MEEIMSYKDSIKCLTDIAKENTKFKKDCYAIINLIKLLMEEKQKTKKYEILWDRLKLKYGSNRTWVIVKTGENKRTHTWFTIRELMRITEESYDKEKAET